MIKLLAAGLTTVLIALVGAAYFGEKTAYFDVARTYRPLARIPVPPEVSSHPATSILTRKTREAMIITYRSWKDVSENQAIKASDCVADRFGELIAHKSGAQLDELALNVSSRRGLVREIKNNMGLVIVECARANNMKLPNE
jgi:hypothetical protein